MDRMELWALEAAGVDNWGNYSDAIDEYYKNNSLSPEYELTDEEKLEALMQGGVDNWSGWDYAIDVLDGAEEW